jgi:hypothetical protein
VVVEAVANQVYMAVVVEQVDFFRLLHNQFLLQQL